MAGGEKVGIAPRRRVAKGPRRPQYLVNGELDKFMMMFNSALMEISVLRERIDTHERLAEMHKLATPSEVNAYQVSLAVQTAREAERDALLNRVYRIMLEELEQAREAINTRVLEEVLVEDDRVLPEALKL